MSNTYNLTNAHLDQFEKDGYLVLDDFYTKDQCTQMYEEAGKIIENVIANEELESVPVFPFVSKGSVPSESDFDYFQKSAGDAKLFLNKHEFTMDPHAHAAKIAQVLRKRANRIGHALHAKDDTFKQVTFNPNVQQVVKKIGFTKPIVCQSMYLLTQSPEGPSGTGHQASTYVIVEPSKLVGFFCAVTDCFKENGCLEVIPGSHKKIGLLNKFIKNPNEKEYNEGKRFIYTEPNPDYPTEGFVPVPLKAGSIMLIDGFLVHRATNSTAEEPRNIYAFHVYDSDKAQFSKQNWMDYNKETFLPLY